MPPDSPNEVDRRVAVLRRQVAAGDRDLAGLERLAAHLEDLLAPYRAADRLDQPFAVTVLWWLDAARRVRATLPDRGVSP